MFYAVFAICYCVKALNFEVGISEIIVIVDIVGGGE